MQPCVEQKLSGSSFVGGYLSGIPAYFDVSRLTVIDTRILHWRGFDAHVPAYSPANAFWGLTDSCMRETLEDIFDSFGEKATFKSLW
jgi:hypothetical protein